MRLAPLSKWGRVRQRRTTKDQRRFQNQIRHFRLLDLEIGLRLQHFFHLQPVGLLVALGAGGPDSGAAGSIQQAELDADCVRNFSHDAAEGVDLANQVAFSNAAHGWIAGHLGDEVDVEGVQRGLQAHAGSRHGGLATGMAGADDHYVEFFGERWHLLLESHAPRGRVQNSLDSSKLWTT